MERKEQSVYTEKVADCTVACDNKSVNLIWKIKTDRSVEGRKKIATTFACGFCNAGFTDIRVREVAAILVAANLPPSINAQMSTEKLGTGRLGRGQLAECNCHCRQSINLQTNYCTKQSSKGLHFRFREISSEMDSCYF